MRFRFSGMHPDELASGRPVAFGDEVDLDRQEVQANQRLIDDGHLLQLSKPKKTETQEDKS